MSIKHIECHDCGNETLIKETKEISEDDIKFCPICGSDNIEVA